jgi:hypothetical protein
MKRKEKRDVLIMKVISVGFIFAISFASIVT